MARGRTLQEIAFLAKSTAAEGIRPSEFIPADEIIWQAATAIVHSHAQQLENTLAFALLGHCNKIAETHKSVNVPMPPVPGRLSTGSQSGAYIGSDTAATAAAQSVPAAQNEPILFYGLNAFCANPLTLMVNAPEACKILSIPTRKDPAFATWKKDVKASAEKRNFELKKGQELQFKLEQLLRDQANCSFTHASDLHKVALANNQQLMQGVFLPLIKAVDSFTRYAMASRSTR